MSEQSSLFQSTTPFVEGQNIDQYSQQLFEQLIQLTKLSNTLPIEEENLYYKSFPEFSSKSNVFGKRLLDLTQQFLNFSQPVNPPQINTIEDADEVADQFDTVIDVLDGILENVDSFADEATGKQKQGIAVISKTSTFSNTKKFKDTAASEYHLVHASSVLRPQLKFADTPDNSNNPFVPKLSYKPNALKPLDPSCFEGKNNDIKPLSKDLQSHITNNLGVKIDKTPSTPHPYEYELDHFVPPERQLKTSSEELYKPLDQTNCIWVDSEAQLREVAAKLNSVTEFAVDLEHHAYRSFQGFVCLMQISTRKEDFLIDTLQLRSHMHVLNESFTNPNILKVLHGSDSDIVWLERDFGIYVVNLFDTGQAARVLEFPSFSLAYLLQHYCGVKVDKKYQLADWRIRPIPQPMLQYAREDTHYLLYVYDRMRNELIQRGNSENNLLLAVYNRSTELCKRKYEKELFDENSHLMLYNKYNLIFSPPQLRVFRDLFAWRDRTARETDESTRYVLPNHMLIHISELMPIDVESLLACCETVPPFVRLHAEDLVSIILEAKKEPAKENIPPLNNSVDRLGSIERPREQNKAPSVKASPVLSTDQLYKTAGWLVSSSNNSQNSLKTTKVAECHTFPESNPSLFDATSETESEDDVETKETLNFIYSSFESPLVDLGCFSAFSNTQQKLQKLQSSKKETENQPPPKETVTVSKPEPVTEDVSTTESSSKTTEKAGGIPQSLAEIYKLSNRNRKRNKEKKKLKEESVVQKGGLSPVQFVDEGSDDEKQSKRQKQGTQTAENANQFMKTIGWLSPDNTKANTEVDKNKTNHINTNDRRKKDDGQKPKIFAPYDHKAAPVNVDSRTSAISDNGQSYGRNLRGNLRPKSGQRSQTFRQNTEHSSGGRSNWFKR